MNNLVGSKQFPPGFRFHPTDEELCMYYLKRKVLGKSLGFELISELDVYKFSPWDLPAMVCCKSSDLDCYFFCPRGKKYPNGGRTNRATECGYWKATGKDRTVEHKNHDVGKIKTLVFHLGKAPKGERTDWVMHEYRLEDGRLADMGVAQDAFVISKVFKKSGIGPKNWEQRGAPFVEEEWDCYDDSDMDLHGGSSGLDSADEQPGNSVSNPNAALVSEPVTSSIHYNSLTVAGSILSTADYPVYSAANPNAGLVSEPADEHPAVQSVSNPNAGLVSEPAATGTSALHSASLYPYEHPDHCAVNANAGLVSQPAVTDALWFEELTAAITAEQPDVPAVASSLEIEDEEDEFDRLLKLLVGEDWGGNNQIIEDDIFSGLEELDDGFLELNDILLP